MAGTKKATQGNIVVEKNVFLLEPMKWFEKATTKRKVVVMNHGDVALVIGGSIDPLR